MAPASRSVGWMTSGGAWVGPRALLPSRRFSIPAPLSRPLLRSSTSTPSPYQRTFHTRPRLSRDVPPPPSSPSPAPFPTASAAAAESMPETVVISARARRPRRPLRVYIYMAAFLLLGLGTGQVAAAIVVPPPLPVPESAEDLALVARIRKDVDKLPIVTALRSERASWLEYEAHMSLRDPERTAHMSAGAMAGSRAVAVQRIFWNGSEKRLVALVFVGGGITGWPGVTHGGAVATLLQENLERAATGPEVYATIDPNSRWLERFEVNYRKPSQADRVYLIRAEVEEDNDDAAPREVSGQIRVKATMEDAVSGLVTADASGWCKGQPVTGPPEEGASLWSSLARLIS